MKLSEKQQLFSRMVTNLFIEIQRLGYDFTIGECYRPREMAVIYAKQGKGIKNSLHELKLAIDLNIFKNGVYLIEGKDFTDIGEYWESIGGTWGERFTRKDGNHFSLEHNGVK